MTTELFDPAYLMQRMREEDNIVGKPIITVTWDSQWMVFSEDERASHPDYDTMMWPAVAYGDDSMTKRSAMKYAEDWANAVGGEVEYE